MVDAKCSPPSVWFALAESDAFHETVFDSMYVADDDDAHIYMSNKLETPTMLIVTIAASLRKMLMSLNLRLMVITFSGNNYLRANKAINHIQCI